MIPMVQFLSLCHMDDTIQTVLSVNGARDTRPVGQKSGTCFLAVRTYPLHSTSRNEPITCPSLRLRRSRSLVTFLLTQQTETADGTFLILAA